MTAPRPSTKARPSARNRMVAREHALATLAQVAENLAGCLAVPVELVAHDVPRTVFDQYEGEDHLDISVTATGGQRVWSKTITLLDGICFYDTPDGDWAAGAEFVHWRGVYVRLSTEEPPEVETTPGWDDDLRDGDLYPA